MSGFLKSGSPLPSPPYSPLPSPPHSASHSPNLSPVISRHRSYSPGAPPLSPLQRRAANGPAQDEVLEVRETPINARNIKCEVAAVASLALLLFLAYKFATANMSMGIDFTNPFSPCH